MYTGKSVTMNVGLQFNNARGGRKKSGRGKGKEKERDLGGHFDLF